MLPEPHGKACTLPRSWLTLALLRSFWPPTSSLTLAERRRPPPWGLYTLRRAEEPPFGCRCANQQS